MNTSDRTAEITAGFCLALASLSLGLCLPFAILTFVRIHPHGDAARAKPALWLKISWVVLLLQVLLMFARMVLIYDDGAYVRLGLEGLRTTLQQLYLIHSLMSPPTLACVLVLQVRLAQAVREVSRMATTTNTTNTNNNKTSGSLPSRLITVVGLGFIGLLSIVRFAVAEYNWAAQISYDVLPHIMNTLAAMDVLIAIFLLLGAIASLAYTIIRARHTPLRNVFFLLLAMTVLTVVRETFGIIYVGLVSLGQTVDVEMQQVVMEATPALNVLGMFFHPLTMVVCLILAWAVLGKKKERGGIWMDGQGVDKVLDEEGRSMSASTVRRLS